MPRHIEEQEISSEMRLSECLLTRRDFSLSIGGIQGCNDSLKRSNKLMTKFIR